MHECERDLTRARGERGFILVVVIMVALLLALLAGTFASSVRGRLTTVSADIETASAEAAADAGVNIAILDLTRSRQQPLRTRLFPADGSPVACALDGERSVVIEVEDEAGKVNLNSDNERLLETFLVALGAPREVAHQYLDRILDFRDGDNDRRPDGAEIDDYAQTPGAGSRAPKNNYFDAVDELDQVLGLPADIVRRAKPYASVNSSLAGLDPAVTQSELKSMLKAAADNSPFGGSLEAQLGLSEDSLPPELLAVSDQRAFTVRALGRTRSGALFVREAVVELPQSGDATFVVRRWRRGTLEGPQRPSGASPPPC